MKKAKISKYFFIYTMLGIGSTISLIPLLWLIRCSFMSTEDMFKLPLILVPKSLNLQNYVDVFTMVPFARFYLNTIVIVLINIIGALISNLSIAYGLARIDFRGRKLMFSLSIGTLMLPAYVQLIPLFLEWNFIGGINTWLPLTVPAFFGNAFFIFMLYQFLRTIPRDYDEAAFMDGANYPAIIVKVILPLAKPAMAVVAIFQFMFTWNDFMAPLLFLNDTKLFTLAIGLRTFISTFYTPWGVLMAAATLTVLPLILLFFMAQKYFVSGLTMGGIKG
ncbi:carbohydrate ABC transporter permease [Oceanispirochaeta sp.]|jgi:multiple sugar transport system permease protein|uniref:carbohydrate ABC transporter permease n=1 Tax=Oceanispirochaeta sp. TaxID=2035350 RepID=UPI0026320519|nr:carbohydrate ABC transporter permease [Oceanispirochaeta sp.]MDA3958286.1 carbohydrate ABC transporter permease [Oceanispirochaeta sp.]